MVRSSEHRLHAHTLGLVCLWCAHRNIPAFACAADKTSMGTLSGAVGRIKHYFLQHNSASVSFQGLNIYHKDEDHHNITHYLLVSHFQRLLLYFKAGSAPHSLGILMHSAATDTYETLVTVSQSSK